MDCFGIGRLNSQDWPGQFDARTIIECSAIDRFREGRFDVAHRSQAGRRTDRRWESLFPFDGERDANALSGIDCIFARHFNFVAPLGDGEFVDRALPGDLAFDENRDAIADRLELAEGVTVHENRAALAANAGEDIENVPPAYRIDPIGRLIKHDQLRLMHQRLGQPHALQHPFGIGRNPHVAPLAHPHRFQKLRGPPSARWAIDLGQCGEKFQHLPARQILRESMVFRQIAHPRQRRLMPYGMPQNAPLRPRRAAPRSS